MQFNKCVISVSLCLTLFIILSCLKDVAGKGTQIGAALSDFILLFFWGPFEREVLLLLSQRNVEENRIWLIVLGREREMKIK